jgi:RNA-directed DNA polymerase
LHGLETFVITKFSRDRAKVIRYADDFVVFCRTLKDIKKAEQLVNEFLKPIGLKLSAEKTRIGHSMEILPGITKFVGFDFLLFHFKNVKCSRHRGVKNTRGVTQPFRLFTRPSNQAVANHKKALNQILVKYKNAPLGAVIERLGSRIKGWTWYHSVTQSTKTFSKMDAWLWKKLWTWAKKRYRSAKKAKEQCFSVKGWAFGYFQNGKSFILDRHDKTRVRKFVKIKPGSSIYDGNLLYFAERLSYSNPRIKSLRGLFIKQNYLCPHCGLLLLLDEIIEFYHVLDNNLNRTEEICFVHCYCHDEIHSTDKFNK